MYISKLLTMLLAERILNGLCRELRDCVHFADHVMNRS